MNKRLILWFTVLLGLVMALVACGAADTNEDAQGPETAVRNAAQAFVDGYNSRDLSQFDAYFAPASVAEAAGLQQTQEAAHQILNEATSGASIQLEKLTILDQQVDTNRGEAVVHYQAQVTIFDDAGASQWSGIVTQHAALQKLNGRWLITGGDQPQITTG